MSRGLRIFGAFLGGLVLGEATAVVGYIIATNYFGMFDRDGGGAMGAIFILGPLLAIIFGVIAAVVVAVRTRKPAG